MRILFVENHAAFAAIARDEFMRGHEVVIVPSLAEARTCLAAGTFDLVLLDFDLDDGRGVDLLADLRRGPAHVRVIGVSARPAGNAALLAAGADLAVGKLEFRKIEAVLRDLEPKQ